MWMTNRLVGNKEIFEDLADKQALSPNTEVDVGDDKGDSGRHKTTTKKTKSRRRLLSDLNFTELDKLKRWKINFRGKLSPDETIAFKLETLQQRKGLGDGCGDSSLLKGLDYFPSGSIVDGLSAALLGRCQMKRMKGTLCVSWPEFDVSVATFVKTLLLKNVLPELENGFDSKGEDVFGFGNKTLDSELYT
ncbi:hypothetical protein Vadar_011727 [Vaccinium darrowii]|uniref:Uncharacterized protein n=1 Tax=Vaccinium darrowii TaxID=229202 RepID=A0ACB7WZU6_9ERIC|nr:hypothetical protein Vadar_011727 [Vaccinium darrowii]